MTGASSDTPWLSDSMKGRGSRAGSPARLKLLGSFRYDERLHDWLFDTALCTGAELRAIRPVSRRWDEEHSRQF